MVLRSSDGCGVLQQRAGGTQYRIAPILWWPQQMVMVPTNYSATGKGSYGWWPGLEPTVPLTVARTLIVEPTALLLGYS